MSAMTTTCCERHASSPLTSNEQAAGLLSIASLGCVSLGAVSGVTPDGPTLCPFRAITGLPCPFCGLTRSLFVLGQGDLERSFEFSPLGGVVAVTAVVVLLLLAGAVLRDRVLRWPRPLLVGGVAFIATAWVFQLMGAVA